MKSQVNIEFIISFLVFLVSLSFIILSIVNNYPIFRKEAIKTILISKSFQISHLLIFDTGYPRDWDSGNVKVIGLSSGQPYLLSSDKIAELNCNETEYEKLKKILGLGSKDFIINITLLNGTVLATCHPKVISLSRPKYWIERTAVVEDSKEIVKINVVVY